MLALHILAMLAILRPERVWTANINHVDFADFFETSRSIGSASQIDGVAAVLTGAEVEAEFQEDVQEAIPELLEVEGDGFSVFLPEWRDDDLETDFGSEVFAKDQHLRGGHMRESTELGFMEAVDMGTIEFATVSISDASGHINGFVSGVELQWKPGPIRMHCARSQEMGVGQTMNPDAHIREVPETLRGVQLIHRINEVLLWGVFLLSLLLIIYTTVRTLVNLITRCCGKAEHTPATVDVKRDHSMPLKLAKVSMDSETIRAPLLSV